MVSSGAVAAGYTKLQLSRDTIENKQALAAIGQPILMKKYAKKFEKENIVVAQVLVTAANLQKTDETKRVRNTIEKLLQNNVVPIVNENDATATEELVVGDNDQLSAYIAKILQANLLVILSDIDAYYSKDPRVHNDAKALKTVHTIAHNELEKTVTPNNTFATGGIVTKLKAASYLLEHNIDTFLSSGFVLDDVKNFLLSNNQTGGTLFTAKQI